MVKITHPSNPFTCIYDTTARLSDYANQFNKLSFVGAKQMHVASVINGALDVVATDISDYGNWLESSYKLANDASEGIAICQKLTEHVLEHMRYQLDAADTDTDPRDILDLEKIDTVIKKKLIALWFTLSENQDRKTDVEELLRQELAAIVSSIVDVLNAACEVFTISGISTFKFLGFDIDGRDRAEKNSLKFELHDEVVAFNAEERAMIANKEEAARQEAKRAAEIEAAREKINEQASMLLKTYEKQLSINNIKTFRFSDATLDVLRNPDTVTKCGKIGALYRFMLAMSDSVRYLPGEEGSDFDRIMGSYQEIDDDIIKYKKPMLIYLKTSFDLTHNDVVDALTFLQDSGVQIVAQYIDTKEYLESYAEDAVVPKTVSVHVLT